MPRKVDTPYSKKNVSRLNSKTRNKRSSPSNEPSSQDAENIIFSPVLTDQNSWSTVESARTSFERGSEAVMELPSAIPEEGVGEETHSDAEPMTPVGTQQTSGADDQERTGEKETLRDTPTNAPSVRMREFISRQLADSPLANMANRQSPLVSVSASQENAVDSPKEPSFLLVHTTPEKSVPEGEEVFSVPVESTERPNRNKTPRRDPLGIPDKTRETRTPQAPLKVKKTRSVMGPQQSSEKADDDSSSELRANDAANERSRRCYSLSSVTSFNPVFSSTPSTSSYSRKKSDIARLLQSNEIAADTKQLFTPPKSGATSKTSNDGDLVNKRSKRQKNISKSVPQKSAAAPKRGRLSQRVSLTKTSEKGRISLRKSLQMTANKLGERETEPQQKDVIPDLAAVVPEVESNAVQMEEDMGNVVGKISQENDQSANLSNLAVDPESTTTVLSNEVNATTDKNEKQGSCSQAEPVRQNRRLSSNKMKPKKRHSQTNRNKPGSKPTKRMKTTKRAKVNATSEEENVSKTLRGEPQQAGTSRSSPTKSAPKRRNKSKEKKKQPKLNDSELVLLHEQEDFDCYTIGPSVIAYASVAPSLDQDSSSQYDSQLSSCPISDMHQKFAGESYHFPPL